VAGTFTLVKLREAPDTPGRKIRWKIVSTGSGLLATFVVRKLMLTAFSALSADDQDPPVLDPADRRFNWRDAVLWAVAAGVGLGIAKVISARLAVAGWEVATGTLPPGVEEPVEI
jgi:hypothetical protein